MTCRSQGHPGAVTLKMIRQPPFQIAQLGSPDDLRAAAALFEAYAASLEVDLSYQGFDAELAGLPGQYAPPAGVLLLARDRPGWRSAAWRSVR